MDPIIGGALIAGGATLASAYLSGEMSEDRQFQAQGFSAWMNDRAWTRSKLAATKGFQRSKQASAKQYKRIKQLRRTHFQDQMFSLRKAGLNPILAAGGGISASGGQPQMATAATAQAVQGQTPVVQPPTVNFAQDAKNIADAFLSEEQIGQAAAKTQSLQADAALAAKQTEAEIARIQKTRQETKNLTQEEKNLYRDYKIKMRQFSAAAVEMQKNLANVNLMKADAELSKERLQEVQANMKVLNQRRDELKAINKRLTKISKAYEGTMGTILGYITAISQALGINFGLILPGLPGRGKGGGYIGNVKPPARHGVGVP